MAGRSHPPGGSKPDARHLEPRRADREPPTRWNTASAAHDGFYRWFLGRGKPLCDDSGGVLNWFGTCTDIEDLKQAQVALQESQERFRLLAESLPLIVWTATAQWAKSTI